eukprot:TRINITY_DN261_c1_g1_i2.p1 TRINITY_DN261_c1_g1~~TRINITY_DN261_c1_g1_i2.p1  ORF type:complete len:410 (+),score=180.18 TRINITY_DN261_c1_g1_i2:1009-2238(+)
MDSVLDRQSVPRMPWHDIHMQVDGPAAADVASNFIQRWNHAIRTSQTFGKIKPYLVGLPEDPSAISKLLPTVNEIGFRDCECQVLRSVASWSSGITEPETSIYKAMRAVITNAKHFIYIENQYFISALKSNTGRQPQNIIADAIYQRLRSAIINKEEFKCVVVIPVFPAGDLNSVTTRYIIKYVYKTISRRKHSVLQKLQEEFPNQNLEDYIIFLSMRNYGEINGVMHTEQVYIHAKLMIVDDQITICGSANINDRSLLGDRDSEIAVITGTEEGKYDSILGGKSTKVSEFSHTLRKRLWCDLVGIAANSEQANVLRDPIAGYQFLLATVKNNTEIYKRVFPYIPDNIRLLSQLNEIKKESIISEHRLLKDIRGYGVLFPMDFLIDESDASMSPKVRDAEFLVPRQCFL